MNQEFVNAYMENKQALMAAFSQKHPSDYIDIVKNVIEIISKEKSWDTPDPERITVIEHGDYQGCLVYVIGAKGYQPHDYWYVKVGYGSCSGCDTLQAIRNYDDEPPTESQVADYMTLALHIVQGLKKMGDDCA